MRVRQSTLSSLCNWLVKRNVLPANPVLKLDRPPHRKEPPKQVPGSEIMDRLIRAARERKRPRDLAIFVILRYTGLRRGSCAGLCVRNLYGEWGLRGVPEKGGNTRDIPLPSVVMQYVHGYVAKVLTTENGPVTPDTPLFWSSWGRRHQGKVHRPMTGQNIWRLCKVYGRLIGFPELKPHDLRHGGSRWRSTASIANLEQVRALLGHKRIETTQVYAQIQPAQLKQSVSFYEAKALEGADDVERGKQRCGFE
jgi:integrase/recombinase XerC